jgi:hypothetical protein
MYVYYRLSVPHNFIDFSFPGVAGGLNIVLEKQDGLNDASIDQQLNSL